MKIFGYRIIRPDRFKKMNDEYMRLRDNSKSDMLQIGNLNNIVSHLQHKIQMQEEIHSRSLDKISRLESALTACQRRIDDQERSIAKYQRIVGTNSKPKWSWEKWK